MNPPRLSRRMQNLAASPIREILKVIDRPGMISFAGGLPAADSFPELPQHIPAKYLQYGPSEGEPELREEVAKMLCSRGLDCTDDQLLILSGSQQGIDLVAKLMIQTGTKVGIEYPTYLAALQVFGLYGASYQPLPDLDHDTPLAYVIPTFQNPTGHCYSEAQRLKLAQQCDRFGTTLFEDDPYSDLVYEKVCRTPVCSMLRKSSWIYQGSFSKSLSPGLRLGYMACSHDLMPYLTHLKQAADLHSNRISQYFVFQALTDPDYAGRMSRLQDAYRSKRDFFEQQLQKHLGELASWSLPAGGLFFWLSLKPSINCDPASLFEKAIENNVAFMPGDFFYPENQCEHPTMRLNFSHAGESDIDRGLGILARLIVEQHGSKSSPNRLRTG